MNRITLVFFYYDILSILFLSILPSMVAFNWNWNRYSHRYFHKFSKLVDFYPTSSISQPFLYTSCSIHSTIWHSRENSNENTYMKSVEDYDEGTDEGTDEGIENEDEENDDSDDDSEFDKFPILSRMKKLYDSVFFYGIDTPKNTRRRFDRDLISKQQRGLESLFFTPSELVGLYGQEKKSTRSSKPLNSNKKPSYGLSTKGSIRKRLDQITKLLNNLQDDVELIDATLLTLPDMENSSSSSSSGSSSNGDESGMKQTEFNSNESMVTKIGLEKKKRELLELISSLKIEYVNLIAEMGS